ncbi:MAG: SAM-dependent DNA methyltransferase [Enterococcus sp.]|nr:SAM-dependent DNA methyltransferase [Enterococcus sp.]
MKITKIKKLITDNKLYESSNLLVFLNDNWDSYDEVELRDIAEYANANRQKNAAYYTDRFIVDDIIQYLPILDKEDISVLEPAVGTGNFIYPFIERFASKYKHINITLNDIDNDSLKIAKFFLSKKSIPSNVTISYSNCDFLGDLFFINDKFDYIIGNPPFMRITKKEANTYGNSVTNLAGQFLLKGMAISNIVALVLPKNFLSTKDYEEARNIVAAKSIDAIIDFGEKGFKGVLIETIALIAGNNAENNDVKVKSYIDDSYNVKPKSYIVDNKFPVWLLYRNSTFDEVANHMDFNIFTIFRDRQITNSKLSNDGDIPVIKSRNIRRDGSGLKKIEGYDKYISKENAQNLKIMDFYKSHDVYLVPNMTYYPRMIQKQGDYIVNGSVAVLKLKLGEKISTDQVKFFSTDLFRKFYMIARNKGTRSLNIDSTSVFWFGKYVG